MDIKELVVEYKGWYVDTVYDNVVTLRSDYTEDILAEINITLEGQNYVTVSYCSSKGDGVFFHASNLTPQEISERTMIAADDYFDYE